MPWTNDPMYSANIVRFVLAKPPKGVKGWNGRIMRAGRVTFSGVWQTKAGAFKAWAGLVDGIKSGKYVAVPIITEQQRAKTIKRRRLR